MAIFELTEYGSCTTFVTHTIQVEAETEEQARQFVREDKNIISRETEHDIDDDYSELQ